MVIASFSELDTKIDWCGISPSDSKLAKKIDVTLAGKFGFAYRSSDFLYAVKNDQVFASEELQPIVCAMQQLKQAGRPQNVRRQLKVQENSWWGIKGGWAVDILFVMLDEVADFNDQLPDDTKKALKQGLAGGLQKFPCFATVLQNAGELTEYRPRQTNLLAAQVEYMAGEASADLIDLLG